MLLTFSEVTRISNIFATTIFQPKQSLLSVIYLFFLIQKELNRIPITIVIESVIAYFVLTSLMPLNIFRWKFPDGFKISVLAVSHIYRPRTCNKHFKYFWYFILISFNRNKKTNMKSKWRNEKNRNKCETLSFSKSEDKFNF